MKQVTIIGAGSWGSALANILCENNNRVLLYDTDVQTVNEINEFHTNRKVPNVTMNSDIEATTNLKEAVNYSDIIVISVPTKVIRLVLKSINELIDSPKLFVNTSKGLEPNTFKRVSQIVEEEIDQRYIDGFVALTGPSHAEEVIVKLPTTICSVSENIEKAKIVQEIFSNHSNFRVYTGNDLLGSELCSAIKNVYAIASGILHGLGFGDNARAGLISRALVEMRRIVVELGAKEETVFGLTGVGDLVVTTTSHFSRNFQAGVKLAKGNNLEETLNSIDMVVEGVRTAKAVYDLVVELNIEAPIITAVYKVIYEHLLPDQAVAQLFNREFKDE